MTVGLSTDEYWDVDGVALNTYAWNISTWGGTARGFPRRRGDDIAIPHVPGRIWTPKVIESTTREFRGWVIGADEYGEVEDEARFRANWQTLRSLLCRPNRRVELTRRWRQDGVLRAASGQAEVLDGFWPLSTGPARAEWEAGLFMADPYFYGSPVLTALTLDTPVTIEVEGDDNARGILVEFSYSLSGAKVTATHDDSTTWVGYSSLTSGTADVDVTEMTAAEGATPTLGKITHDGAIQWLVLPPGDVTLELTGTGTGTAVVTHTPVWV